jgi:hypothetical protein
MVSATLLLAALATLAAASPASGAEPSIQRRQDEDACACARRTFGGASCTEIPTNPCVFCCQGVGRLFLPLECSGCQRPEGEYREALDAYCNGHGHVLRAGYNCSA